MKIFALWSLLVLAAFARLNVVASYPYIGELVRAVGGERVGVEVLASAKDDPHFVTPKPSLILKARRADLLVLNGAELEIGWLPPVIAQSNNPAIRPGQKGFLELSGFVHLREVPQSLSRSGGDVHPSGNPHFALDPHEIPALAQAIADRLVLIDEANAAFYRANLKGFLSRWQTKLENWDARMKTLEEQKVVQYHELFNYFLERYRLQTVAVLEPLPGIVPTARHTQEVIERVKSEGVKLILQDVYHSGQTARFVAERTGAKVVVLPHDTGALEGTGTLEGFYDALIDGMTR